MLNVDQGGQLFLGLAAAGILKLSAAYLIRQKRSEKFEQVGTVKELIMYPFKSCQGVYVNEAECTRYGLKSNGISDRHWMVVDPTGRFLSQKEQPKLALVTISICDDHILIEAPSVQPIRVEKSPLLDQTKVTPCSVWSGNMEGVDCGDEVAQWFCDYLGVRGYRVMYYSHDLRERNFANEDKGWKNNAVLDDVSAYTNYGTYMVLTQASLVALNKKLTTKVTMRNFRPNIVVDGTEEFDEDNWQEIRIGDKVRLRCLDGRTRCVITTVDPDTGVKHAQGEPLTTLRSFRCRPPYGDRAIFGANAAPDVCGFVKVGDPVYAIKGPRV